MELVGSGSSTSIRVTSTIDGFDQKRFDSLDRTAGFPSSFTRLRQRERDPRWVCRYLGWTEGGLLKAALPVYRSRMTSWPDAAYDPRLWDLPDAVADQCAPGAVLLAGGCGDRRTGLHADADARTPAALRRLLAEVARLAAADERCVVFPYVHAAAREALTAATGNRITWCKLTGEAHVFGLADLNSEYKLPRKVRQTLRADERRISALAVTQGDPVPWKEAPSWVEELISEQHTAKGDPEPPEFVSFRYADLDENPGLEVFVLTAEAAGLRGVTTVVVWDDEMEVCEVGLSGDNSEERLAIYTSVVFHQPFRIARDRGIDHIRYGSTSHTPKLARGAVFTQWYGGVLDTSETKRLANAGPRDG